MGMKWTAAVAAIVMATGACADADEADNIGTPGAEAELERAGAPAGPAVVATTGAMIDPETATRDQLQVLPGMNDAATIALMDGRPYANMLEVDAALAPHVAEADRELLYGQLWKPLDLNTATEEEILLIPAVDERMPHEFEEYRPYTSMDQFRREIGKYVDADEVARYERYVTIRQ